jgi:hypothetical protein
MSHRRDVTEILRNFDILPDSAVIPRRAVALLLGLSTRSLRRNQPFPNIAITPRVIGHRVGDIRAELAKHQSPLERGRSVPTIAA